MKSTKTPTDQLYKYSIDFLTVPVNIFLFPGATFRKVVTIGLSLSGFSGNQKIIIKVCLDGNRMRGSLLTSLFTFWLSSIQFYVQRASCRV